MAKVKHSVTIDPAKLAEARNLVRVSTLSELLDVALSRMIREEIERRHVEGYLKYPQTAADASWAELERDPTDIADHTDWAALYGVGPQ